MILMLRSLQLQGTSSPHYASNVDLNDLSLSVVFSNDCTVTNSFGADKVSSVLTAIWNEVSQAKHP